jgi:hypothetical protein
MRPAAVIWIACSRHVLRLQGVLNTMESVRKRLKPGVAWPDMHRLADRCNLEALAAEVSMHAKSDAGSVTCVGMFQA